MGGKSKNLNLQNDRLLAAVTKQNLTPVFDEKASTETLYSAMPQIA